MDGPGDGPEHDPAGPGKDSPIFVVGQPRSGTTLLAAMLGSHPHIDCGPETLFFARLAEAGAASVVDPARWPDAGADFVCSLRLKDASVAELFGQDRDSVRAFLAERPASIAPLLESLTAARAATHGKLRWAEKTPLHLQHVALIRRTWPDATIVRVVRDPRDVALSLTRVPFGHPSLAVNLMHIARLDAESRQVVSADPRSLTVRYEDLLADPELELRRVVEAIGEPYDPVMIERPDAADGLAAAHEWWKQKAAEPLDTSRVAAWRRELSPVDQRMAALICNEQLEAYGYDGARRPRRRVAFVPLREHLVAEHEGLVRDLAKSDTVVGEPRPRRPERLATFSDAVFWGDRDQFGLSLGGGPAARALSVLRLALDLGRRRIRRRPALWVAGSSAQRRSDSIADRAAGRVVSALAARTVAADLGRRLGAGSAPSGPA